MTTMDVIEGKIQDILAGRGPIAGAAELATLHRLRAERATRGGADAGEVVNYWTFPSGTRAELREGLEKFTGRPSVYFLFSRELSDADRAFLRDDVLSQRQFLEHALRGRVVGLPARPSLEIERIFGRRESVPAPQVAPFQTHALTGKARLCVALADGATCLFIAYDEGATRDDVKDVLQVGPTMLFSLLPRLMKAGFAQP